MASNVNSDLEDNSRENSDAESSDIYSEEEESSEEESEEDLSESGEDVSDSEQPENRSLWVRVYPPEDSCPGDDVTFSVRNPGVRNMPPSTSTPLVYFLLFLTEEILAKIVRETKRYAETFFVTNRDNLSPQSRARQWARAAFDVTKLKKYLGLTLLMGLLKKKDVKMYWSTKFSCLSTPYFPSVMSRNLYQLISKFLHCHDNTREEARRDSPRYDPLHKFRLLLDSLNSSCKRYYVPERLLSIDESLIGLKNRTELIQYIPNKHHHKWGVKLYAVTESQTGYPLHTTVYCGKRRAPAASELGHSYDVVFDLLTQAGLLNKGYHLFVDNFYTSPTLADHLFSNDTLLTGTLRSNRKGVPAVIKAAKPKEKECVYFRKGSMLCLSWREKKSQKNPCLLLSTGIPAGMVQHMKRDRTVKELPHPVSTYNKHMGGVDLLDQMVDHVAAERSYHKFWKKCFFAVIDRMTFCAYLLYEKNTAAERKLSRFDFMCTLVEELCGKSLNEEGETQPVQPQEHRIERIPDGKARDCAVCSDRSVPGGRKRAKTQCVGCQVGVHLDCFESLDHMTKKRKLIADS